MNDKENLTLDQKSLKALFHTPLQLLEHALECLCWFEVLPHIKNQVFVESLTLVYDGVKEICIYSLLEGVYLLAQ